MSHKDKHSKSTGNASGRPTSSTRNPTAPARRKLLRIVGASGGAAVATLLDSRWRTPVVRAVILPAHAQTSPAPGCTVTLTAAFSPESTTAYSVSLFVGGSILTSVAVTGGGPTSLAASATFPPGNYSAGLSVLQATTQSLTWSFSESCCNGSYETALSNSSSDFVGLASPSISDDGECDILVFAAGP